MKKLSIAILGLFCATTLAVRAQDEKPKRTEEQKALMKEMVTKYDANKDGKLDKEERAKISAEDKAKMEKAGLMRKKADAPAAAAPAEKK
jgi:hypothetical protein